MVTTVLAYAVATAVPLIALYVIFTLDLYGTGSFRTVLSCFAWGIVAFGLAFEFHTLLLNRGIIYYDTFARFVAPVTEEILKALLLIYLVRRPNFTYFVDGAIYGFAIGIGFAVFENYFYIADSYAAFGTAFSRVISTNLMHATTSAVVGIALGHARFQKFPTSVLTLLGGLLVGMAIHTGFNNMVTRVYSGLLLLYAATVGVAGFGFIAFMIKRGLQEGRKWIEEALGEADRVTAGEKAVVNQLSDIYDLLQPIRERFGEEKTKQVEQFLKLQAQLGIKRKTLDKLSDDRMRKGVEEQMDEIRARMDGVRRDVGAYVMLYVRAIIPPDTSPLWNMLENAIQQRIAERPASAGPSLWAKLGERTTEVAAGGDEER
nr:PrsW family intramembrane metalloprotease [Anaerolineae bacterium]